METNRLEAFSDGVMAIIITIMVLELKVPHGEEFSSLLPLWPVFLSYALSFAYVGVYWNNHHHMMKAAATVNGAVLWSNLHLLFWLSLLPFTTGWMGENHFTRGPLILYGLNLLACAIAYYILQTCLIRHQGADSLLRKAVGSDVKGKGSPLVYIAGIVAAWCNQPQIAFAIFVIGALIWLIPDRRIERAIAQRE